MPVVSPPTIAALPTPPSTASPANFDTRADAFLAALPTFQTEQNALAANVFANATDAAASATTAATATTQAGIATTQAGIATTQAGIATTQAGIATTQASNASASAAAAAVSAGSVASYPTQTGNSGKFLQTNGTTPSWVLATAGDHEVYVNSGNGLGSVNTYVRRFTTTVRNVGTAITYADSATLGASFTINETGFYSVYYKDAMSEGLGRCCIGINTSPTAAAGTVFATPSALAGDFYCQAIGALEFSSRVVRLTAGDVLRAYIDHTTNSFGDAAVIIRKVGV